MNKNQIISFIETQLKEGRITREDLMTIGTGAPEGSSAPMAPMSPMAAIKSEETSKNITTTFYGIGATIAVIGAVILIVQHWHDIGFGGRILVTLGISFVCYVGGLLLKGEEHSKLSQVLFTISAALAPIGVFVLLNESKVRYTWETQMMISGALTAIYGTALWISRRNILVLVTSGFATWLYYAVLFDMFGDYHNSSILKWATMLLGVVYILVSYTYRSLSSIEDSYERESVYNFLTGVGTLAILGAGITIGGAFDVIYIGLLFAAFYASIFLKSRPMLGLGSLFLMAHVIKLTSKYFVGSVGWPVALIFVGFLIIGIGYFTYYLNKTYVSVKA